MAEAPRHYTFIETPVFTKRIADLASPETLQAIQLELVENPERWPVIRGLQGARKGRVANPKSSAGKRGSFRYIYLYLPLVGRVHFVLHHLNRTDS
jgi:hypothetical protein